LLFGTQNTVTYYQKYTPTDCFFGDYPQVVAVNWWDSLFHH